MPTSGDLLQVRDVTVRYGGVEALSEVSLSVRPGEVVALLGANGAGKTSLLRSISGLVPIHSGAVVFQGAEIHGRRADIVTRRGVAHVPEGRRVVAPLTVEENLLLAGRAARRSTRKQLTESLEDIYLLFPRLRERRLQPSGLMSGGEQQMLAIGRGFMARPDLLVLDEPSMGLAPIVIQEIYRALSRRGGAMAATAILLAEQSTAIALSLAERACVLSRGRVVFFGPAADVDADMTVDAYLGSQRSSRTTNPAD